jgi:hypothetical protein
MRAVVPPPGAKRTRAVADAASGGDAATAREAPPASASEEDAVPLEAEELGVEPGTPATEPADLPPVEFWDGRSG